MQRKLPVRDLIRRIARRSVTRAEVIEWSGSATGAAGALLLALNIPFSGYAWILMLMSNAAWIAYARANHVHSILLMQLVYTTTSLVGIYRWLM